MKHLFTLGHAVLDRAEPRPVVGVALPRIELPAPERCGGRPVMEVFALRRTTREFASNDLSLALLGDLLWAANGINRDEEGGRTAPSALGVHEIDVYAVLSRGLYRYDPLRHGLDLVVAKDLRGLTGYQDFVGAAPLDLVYVADFSRMGDVPPSNREAFASASAGAIAQNVYLFCASAGLAAAARGWLNRSALAEQMQLKRNCVPVLAQTVGHFVAPTSQ
ncbi:nitroreductase [Caballeronia terrestris]|uniref:Nitroreductase n=2 Tax=Caballeronia TaxID=1827195 RepID=A0A158KV10_9BURK|nr:MULTISPECIES: SagB/ThcOx family dehydrogenase [Caballeronia]SAL68651.1 nitroreductase [Caballeronia humi]SAL84579.1 nitroreductase [Caballeronia terrestris]